MQIVLPKEYEPEVIRLGEQLAYLDRKVELLRPPAHRLGPHTLEGALIRRQLAVARDEPISGRDEPEIYCRGQVVRRLLISESSHAAHKACVLEAGVEVLSWCQEMGQFRLAS
jgi:hypothetical protein